MECVIGGPRYFQALFDQPVVGVAAVDASGALVELNARCAEIFGAEVDALVGTELAARVEPEHRPRLRTALGELARRPGRAPVAELACRRLDSQPIRVRVTRASPTVPALPARHVVIIEDVTERWQAETQLATYSELLAESQRIAAIGTSERERAMLASRESAARERVALEASRAKTEFLAHMSHELRTPLNAVLGLSEALLERVFGELVDAQANALATIHASGRHLLELINDVLDIARVESGKLPIEPEQVLLRPLIDEAAALVHNQLAAKDQRLVIELAPVLPPLDIDRRRIKQVLLNLLGNAAKFSPIGATVTLRAAPGPGGARQIDIAVSDNGPGIAPGDRARIFEPFVTLDPSMSRAHGGAGLGLTLAKRIIELHGGQIRVDGDRGRGATFTISLPVSSSYAGEPPAMHRTPPRDVAAPARAGGRTVLLAEDDDATVLTVRSYLENHGYLVQVVRDGVAVLDAAAAHDVAVVLLDIQLPGLDGLEVTRRLRARDGERTPIIALTAHAMSGDEQRCLAAGATAYMAKPVRLRHLEQTIDRLLEDR